MKLPRIIIFTSVLWVLFSLGNTTVAQKQNLTHLIDEYSEFEWQLSVAKNALNQASAPVVDKIKQINQAGKNTAERIRAIGVDRGNTSTEARGLIRLAYTLALENQPAQKWRQKIDRSFELVANDIHSIANVECLMYSGHILGMLDNAPAESKKGRRNLEEAIRIAVELQDDVLLTRTLNFLAEVLLNQEQVYLARDYAVRGLIVAESTDDEVLLKVALTAMIVVCRYHHGVDAVLPYAKRLQKIAPDSQIARFTIEFCECDPKLISLLTEAIQISKQSAPSMAVTKELAGYQHLLGLIFQRRGELPKAIEFFSQALKSYQTIDDSQSLASCALPIAVLKIELGQEVNDLAALECYAPMTNSFRRNLEFAEQMADIYFAVGEYEKAKEWKANSHEYHQELSMRALANSQTSGTNFWDVELKYREAKAAQKEQRKENQLYYSTLAGIAAFLVLALAVGWTQYQTIKKSNAKLERIVDERTRSLSTAYEKAELATHSKSEFLAKVNHDIRNPLTAIIGYCDLLQFNADSGEIASEQTEQFVSGITSSSKHLLKIVEDVLDVSRIEQGHVSITNGWFCLQEMCKDIEKMVSEQVNQTTLQFHIRCDSESENVFSDEVRIKQIILNLVNNAIKFTETGFVHVEISHQPVEDSSQLQIEVSDSGSGIPALLQASIFEPFFQCPTDKAHAGAGLGLNIVSSLVEAIGGKIQVDSQESVGTKFNVSLPIETTEAVVQQKFVSAEPTPRYKVLVVDDKPNVRDAICKQLQIQGILTECSDSIQPTLSIIKSWKPDFVFLDLRMPGTSGFEFFTVIREQVSPPPYCVAVTGDATEQVKEKCLASGFDGFLAKPIRNSKLSALFEQFKTQARLS